MLCHVKYPAIGYLGQNTFLMMGITFLLDLLHTGNLTLSVAQCMKNLIYLLIYLKSLSAYFASALRNTAVMKRLCRTPEGLTKIRYDNSAVPVEI